jgi:hypothetical protein
MFGKRKYLIYLLIFFISESFKKPKMVSVNETWKNLFNLLKMRKFIMITKSWEEKMIEVDLICQRMKCQTKDGMEDH